MRGAPPVVVFDRVSARYAGAPAPALRHASFAVEEGELALVVGRTGSGKSTLLGAVNGTVPHFTGGLLSGRVTVAGRDTRTHRPRDLADVVGVVGQDPVRGFVTDTVEEELAYTLEQLALPGDVMRRRVEETLDLLGIAELRDAPLRDLSGGEQQRVAIGAALTAHPSVLILDEPTSALDPGAAEDVLATLSRLVHDHGLTVLLAEHRVERVVGFADRVIHVSPTGEVSDGPPAEVMRSSSIAPPLVELGRWAGWDPLPLSVRDARRAAGLLRDTLPEHPAPSRVTQGGPALLEAAEVTVTHDGLDAVRWVDTTMQAGSVCALMGRNGAGKSSLLWALQGTGRRSAGTVQVHGVDGACDPASVGAARRRALVGLVPQSASDLLYLETVGAECAQADTEAAAEPGTCRALLEELAPGIPVDRHPRDLSEGQRLALVVCVQLTAAPRVMLLDEPTRGLDYPAKAALSRFLRRLADDGAAVVVATHDVEFAATVADRVVVMADGHVVADGPAAGVLCGSPAFAPQVAKVLAPAPWLTVEQVRAAAEVVRR